MTRRHLLASPACLAAANALDLPKPVRVAIYGKEGHTGEVTGPAKQFPKQIEVVAQAAAGSEPFAALLDRVKPDVAAICGDNGVRAAAILECAKRGLPFIAEKPFAIRLDDLAKIRELVNKNKVRMTMMLPMRFTPPYLALKAIVESGAIGEVAQIGGQKSYKVGADSAWKNKASSYGGTIPWVGIHMADLMRWTSGREFTEAAAFQSRIGYPEIADRENTAAVLFRLDNGGAATLRMDYLRPDTAPTHEDDRLRLAGTLGVAEYQAWHGVTLVTKSEKPRKVEDLPPARSLFVEFLKALYLGGPDPVSAADVFRMNEICLKARDAANSSRVVRL
jgi:predicted dehydrogenase